MKTTIFILILILISTIAFGSSGAIYPEMTLGDSLHLGAGIAFAVGATVTSIILPYTADSARSPIFFKDVPDFYRFAALDATFIFLTLLHIGQAFGPDISSPTLGNFKRAPAPSFELDFSHLQPIPINPFIDTLIFSEAYLKF